MNNFEIIDDKGVIHSGTQEEMEYAFDVMTQGTYKYSKKEVQNYTTTWDGDLKLIQVLKIAK